MGRLDGAARVALWSAASECAGPPGVLRRRMIDAHVAPAGSPAGPPDPAAMTLCFEDIAVGQSLAPLVKGPMHTAHIMRWSAAIENWHRIHYDWRFATGHDGLPDVLVNGSWKQHVLVQLVKDGLGEGGWLWRLRFRYRAMDVAGDTVFAHAEVIGKDRVGDHGFVTLRLALRNQREVVSTTGAAIGVLALRGGPAVPYPFTPSAEQEALTLPAEE